MLDRERIMAKIDVLDGYLRELRTIAPANFEEYATIEKRRACERLLQVSIECVIDISSLLVTGLRLGLPASVLNFQAGSAYSSFCLMRSIPCRFPFWLGG